MKKIIAIIFGLILISTFAFGLSSCGKDEKDKNDEKKEQKEDEKPSEHVHDYGSWIAEVSATCLNEGTLGHYYCSGCGKNFDKNYNELDSLVIQKAEHSFGDVIIDEAPTGTEKGAGHKTCSVCGKEETIEIESWSPKGKTFIFSRYLISADFSTAEDWILSKEIDSKEDMTNEQYAEWMLGEYSNMLSEISTYTFDALELTVTQTASFSFGIGMDNTITNSYSYTIEGNDIIINGAIPALIINENTINIAEYNKVDRIYIYS